MSMLRRLGPCALVVLALAGAAPARAQDDPPPRAQGHLAKGDYFFKSGYYLKASEHYRLALLEDPSSPWKKLAFGHALFAIGNYSYSSYALRRGVAQLDGSEFRPDIESLFPSKRQFTQALRDLKRYVTYSPRDPAGLTVLGYVLFSIQGEERRCRDMFQYLKRLDPNDPFAEFFLGQLKSRGPIPEGADETPLIDETEETTPPPPPPPPAPKPVEPKPRVAAPPPPPPAPKPDLEKVLGDPERAQERAEGEWPSAVPAPSQ